MSKGEQGTKQSAICIVDVKIRVFCDIGMTQGAIKQKRDLFFSF